MQIPIVDESDNFLYYKDAYTRDRRTEITRSAVLWVIDEYNKILLSRRSPTKSHFPNTWGPSVGGILEEGETYESNVRKEAEEEIGLHVGELVLGDKKRESDDHEYFNQYFFAHVDSSAQFNFEDHEVDKAKWLSLAELKEMYTNNKEIFIPDFKSSLEVIEKYLTK